MKFPSLSSLYEKASRSLLRFPLAILLAVVATMISVFLIHSERGDDDIVFSRCSNAIVSCYLGMLLSIVGGVWAERKGWRGWTFAGVQLAVLGIVLLYYFLMPDHFEARTVIRWVLYAFGLHFLISVIAFAGSDRIDGFWRYNKDLFIRILTSLLYTSVLYMGLALALLAIEQLFKANISYKCYADIWVILVGVFNTWFFLSGFPTDDGDMTPGDYPKGLKIFTQYVLLPLLMVYLGILYVYLFKIIVTAHWPVGWVAYLVLGFSVAGMLALLLIYPLRNDEKNKWINGYSRFFYFALLPLLGMLGVAIWKRVNAYGITELRYFVLLLAFWLLLMSLYFLFSRKKNIQMIPLTLCLVAFLCSFGPWGVFNVSRYSQQHRLQVLLEKYSILKNGKITKAKAKIPSDDVEDITSITGYIVDVHGYETLQPWFTENLDSMMRKNDLSAKHNSWRRKEAILDLMDVHGGGSGYADWMTEYFTCTLDDTAVVSTDGLPWLISDFEIVPPEDAREVTSYRVNGESLALSLDSAVNHVRLRFSAGDGAAQKRYDCTIGLQPLLQDKDVLKGFSKALPLEKMTLPVLCSGWKGKMVITLMRGVKREGEAHLTELKGYLLLGPGQ